MAKYLNLPTFLISSFLIRLLVTGASIGDSIVMIALCSLYGGWYFLELKKEPEINKKTMDRVVELEEKVIKMQDKVGALTLNASLKR